MAHRAQNPQPDACPAGNGRLRLYLLLALLLCAPAWCEESALQRKLLYQPWRHAVEAPPKGVRELTFRASDGVQLHAWYLPGDPMVLFYHGNGGNITTLGPQFEAFRSAGCGVLAGDYRGYGKSHGAPSEKGLYLDALAAYDEAVRQGHKRIVPYGHSLGAAVAIYVAGKRPCAGLILQSGFTSVADAARHVHGAVLARQATGYPSLERIRKLDVPLLVMHGVEDDTIPVAQGKALYEASPSQQKELFLVEGAGHNNLRARAGKSYLTKLKAFLNGI